MKKQYSIMMLVLLTCFSVGYAQESACGPFPVPYQETFDAWDDENPLDCWTIVDANQDGLTWVSEYIPPMDNTTAYMGGGKAGDDWLVSPCLSIPESGAGLSLRYMTSKTSSGVSLRICIAEENDLAALEQNILYEGHGLITEWLVFDVLNADLSDYAGKEVYIAIQACSESATYNDLYVDDFRLETCAVPTQVEIWAGTDSAKVAFVSAADRQEAEYKEAASSFWLPVEKVGNPVVIAGLSPAADYDFRLRNRCSETDSSQWVEYSFRTQMQPVLYPLDEDFNEVALGSLPGDWASRNPEAPWQVTEHSLAPDLAHFAYFNSISSPVGTTGVLETPLMDIRGVEQLSLSFLYLNSGYSADNPNNFCVYISTDEGQIYDTLFANLTTTALTIGSETVDLAPYIQGAESLRVYFSATSNQNGKFDIFLDDVYIGSNLACVRPVSMELEQKTSSEVQVSWQPDSANADAACQIVYWTEPDGVKACTGEVSSPHLLEGMAVAPYRIGVRAICGQGDTSDLRHEVYVPEPCLPVQDLQVSDTAAFQAVIEWKHDEASRYNVYYQAEGSETRHEQSLEESRWEIDGLDAGTLYTAGVQAVLASGDTSRWATVSFFTPCAGYMVLPLAEGAEKTGQSLSDVAWLPSCWDYEEVEGTYSQQFWQRTSNANFVHDGKYAIQFLSSRISSNGIGRLVSEPFQTPNAVRITFWFYHTMYASAATLRIGLLSDTGTMYIDTLVHAAGENRWAEYSYEVEDVDACRLVLEGCVGSPSSVQNMTLDNLRIEEIFSLNLAAESLRPIPPLADMPAQEVSFSVRNAGRENFAADVVFCYSLDAGDTVREEYSFEGSPLEPDSLFTYSFTEKLLVDTYGIHQVQAWVESEADMLAADNALTMEIENYEPFVLPYTWILSEGMEHLDYMQAVDADGNGTTWQAGVGWFNCGGQEDGDDILFFPGMSMPEGRYRFGIVLGKELVESEAVKVYLSGYPSLEALDSATVLTEAYLVEAYIDTLWLEADVPQQEVRYMGFRTSSHAGLNAYGALVEPLSEVFRMEAQACANEPYPWGDEFLTESGVYSDTAQTRSGMDSITVLNLTVHPTYLFELDTTLCEGLSIEFGGETYSEEGLHERLLQTRYGCDSIYRLNLHYTPLPSAPVITRQDEGSEIWLVSDQPANNQWYKDEEAIDGATEERYAVVANGSYYATVSNRCGMSDPSNVIEIKGLGNGLFEDGAVSVYPNPAIGHVWIRSGKALIDKVVLKDLSGRTLLEKKASVNPLNLDLSGFSAGIYLLEVTLGAETGIFKLQLLH